LCEESPAFAGLLFLKERPVTSGINRLQHWPGLFCKNEVCQNRALLQQKLMSVAKRTLQKYSSFAKKKPIVEGLYYGVATISRILKIIRLFCRKSSLL